MANVTAFLRLLIEILRIVGLNVLTVPTLSAVNVKEYEMNLSKRINAQLSLPPNNKKKMYIGK